MKSVRPRHLPESLREAIKEARKAKGWSQLELGQKVRLAQRHISGIETGKIVPRFDTLLEIVRTLGHDLVLVSSAMVPAVKAMERDFRNQADEKEERPLYADDK